MDISRYFKPVPAMPEQGVADDYATLGLKVRGVFNRIAYLHFEDMGENNPHKVYEFASGKYTGDRIEASNMSYLAWFIGNVVATRPNVDEMIRTELIDDLMRWGTLFVTEHRIQSAIENFDARIPFFTSTNKLAQMYGNKMVIYRLRHNLSQVGYKMTRKDKKVLEYANKIEDEMLEAYAVARYEMSEAQAMSKYDLTDFWKEQEIPY